MTAGSKDEMGRSSRRTNLAAGGVRIMGARGALGGSGFPAGRESNLPDSEPKCLNFARTKRISEFPKTRCGERWGQRCHRR
ncbi:hypothetical protein NL676_038170 [Syzygium grande]|nr:hypothetical protein NL676_038170 [Syzygium grande]